MDEQWIEEQYELKPRWFQLRDLKLAANELGDNEIGYLVDSYYDVQEFRKMHANRLAAAKKAGEPNVLLVRLDHDARELESNIQSTLDRWGRERPLCQWARSIVGIGPVIAAGLSSHIDITRAPTAGHIWRFAGLDPSQTWERGQKRPWNAGLKVLCWKIGEGFVKVYRNPNDVYGKVYERQKELYVARNQQGEYKERALAKAEDLRKSGKTSSESYRAYKEGHLPQGHVHSMAKRYATKLFLAHYHHVAYELQYGVPPPRPYVLEHGGHAHFIAPPNWPLD